MIHHFLPSALCCFGVSMAQVCRSDFTIEACGLSRLVFRVQQFLSFRFVRCPKAALRAGFGVFNVINIPARFFREHSVCFFHYFSWLSMREIENFLLASSGRARSESE